MTFEPATDPELVRRIITHPRIYEHVSDDFSAPAAEFEPILDSPQLTYLIVRDGDEVLGLFGLIRPSVLVVDIHTCLLPTAWGPRARAAAREVQQWVFAAYPEVMQIVTVVPSYNTLALRLACGAGLREYGRLPKSWRKNGRLCDQILLHAGREE